MCGIVAMLGKNEVNLRLYDSLTVLQHRGQDAAGIATADGRNIHLRKDNGLVKDVFRTRHMRELKGTMGIGHVRYPTAGCSSAAEAQPFSLNSPYGIVLAHNGTLTNATDLKQELYESDGRHLVTNSDSEVLLNIFAKELRATPVCSLTNSHIYKAVSTVHNRCKGAYSVVIMIPEFGVIAFRDPHGIRPLVFGSRKEGEDTEYMVSSESVALDVLDFQKERDVTPGEVVIFRPNQPVIAHQCAKSPKLTPCLFELVYLARPDSIIDGISVYKSRLRMGDYLAKEIQEGWPEHDIDVVIPVPDTSRSAAIQVAHHLGVKYREGFIKNRYIGRTFIMPGQAIRKKSVRKKLNACDLEFKDKNVLLVDDSIVRGTTCQQIIQMARDAGAKRVYFASAAPPVRYPNVYGIDMPVADELIAHDKTTQQVCEAIGADRLFYLSLQSLRLAAGEGNQNISSFEDSVFSGNYITGDITSRYLEVLEEQRSDAAKKDMNSAEEPALA